VDAADVVDEADLEEVAEEAAPAAARPPVPPPASRVDDAHPAGGSAIAGAAARAPAEDTVRASVPEPSPPRVLDSVRMGTPAESREPARDEHPAAPSAAGAPPPADAVEELSGDDLEAAEEPVRDGVVDVAVAAARKAIADGGGPVRIRFYEAELAALGSDDKARRALYEHELGELTEAAGDESAAVKAYAKALQSDATLKPNLWAIRRVFQRRALWPNLLKLLDAEIRFARTDGEKAELWLEKGQLYEDKLAQPAEAEECYHKAAQAHPQSVGPWLALEKVYARKGDLAGLEKVLRGQASATLEPGRRAALLLDLARLQDSVSGGTVERALELCREAYQTGAEPQRALDELRRIARKAGRVEDVLWALEAGALLLQQKIEAAGAADRPALIDRLIAVRRQQAREAQALPEDGGARAWEYLSKAFELRSDEPLTLRDLSDAAESLGRWDDVANLLQRRIEAAPPELRPSLQLERADALRRANRQKDAEAAEAEIQRDLPQHLGLQISRERDALVNGDWGRLASLYQHEAEQALAGRTPDGKADPEWAAIAFTQAATLLGDRAGRDAEAQAALEKAREAQPGYAPAFDALERLYARAGKHAEHAALLEAELARAPAGPRTRRLYETLIGVREQGLDDPAGAAQAARRLCELRPDDVRLRMRVVELDRAAGRWLDVSEDLKQLIAVLDGDRKLEAILQRAEVLERRLGDDGAAQKAFKEALALRPGEPRAADGFERISRRRSGAASGLHERPEEGDWDDLAGALEREAEATLDPDRATQVLLKLGELHERERNAPADAARTYAELLDKVPGNAAALRGLERVQALLGDQAKRVQAIEQQVDVIGDPGACLELLTLAGELAEDQLKDDERADDAYRRALQQGSSPHAALGRFRVAVRKRAAASIGETLSLLEALLGDAPDGARATLLDERAWAQRVNGDLEAAATLTQEALDQPSGVTQLPGMQRARLAAREGGAFALGDALEALAHNSTDPALQAVLLRRAGQLALGAGAEDVARARIEKGRALLPSDPELVIALADLPSSLAGDPDVLQARIALSDGAAQVEWILERAEALESAGRLAEASREATRALAVDPKHLPALELMRRLARAGGDDVGLARASALLAAEVQDQERSASLYHQGGEAFERAHLREEAAAAYRAALDRTPLDGAAFNRARALLAAIYAEKKQPGMLVELYTHRLAHLSDEQHREDRAQLHLDRAQLYADEGDRDAAEKDLRAVLVDHPDHLGGMRRLAELLALQPHGRAEAVQLLERYLELETAAEHRRATLLRLAELEEAPGGRPERAVEQLLAAIELAPTPTASLPDRDRLAQLYLRLRSWQRAVQTLQKMVELEGDPARQAALELRMAQIYKDGFADPRAAVESLQRALRHAPLQLEALAQLVGFAADGKVVQLELDDKLGHALDAARAQAAPSQPDSYQALVRIHSWRADEDARLIAAQAAALARREKPTDRDDVIDPVRELSPAAWERLWPETARSVGLEIWRLGVEASMKVYGPQLDQLGVGKPERVNPKLVPTAWPHLDKLARALGVTGYELYQARDREELAVGANGDTPVVVAGAAFAERLTPRLRFRLGRKLALLRERLSPVGRADDDEMNVFFAACAKVAELSRPPSVQPADEARVDERAKALARPLGRKERKAMTALGARVALLPSPSEWRRAVLDGAARAALVVGGDLAAALAELSLPFTDPRALALIAFALSDELASLRRELGLRP